MAAILRIYLRAVEKHPLRTSACTTGTLMGLGDTICQIFIERTKNYDFVRTGRFAGFGLFIGGPIFRIWYKTVDKIFKGQKFAPAKMVLADQGAFAPLFLPFFLGTMGFMRGESASHIKTQIKKDFIPVMSANYKVWPLVQICNFVFVPLQHRVLTVNVVSIFWNTYLAWFAETKNIKLSHTDRERKIEVPLDIEKQSNSAVRTTKTISENVPS